MTQTRVRPHCWSARLLRDAETSTASSRCSYNSRHMPAECRLPHWVPRSSKRSTLSADRSHATHQRRPRNPAVAVIGPMLEQVARVPHRKSFSQPLGLLCRRCRSGLENLVSDGPSTIAAARPASTSWPGRRSPPRRTARSTNSRAAVASRVGRTANTVNSLGHKSPQPGLSVFFLGRRFVAFHVFFRGELGRQFVVRRPHRGGHLVLDLDRQRRRARLTQKRGEELRRAPLALTIVGHQQRDEGHQPRSRLALRHAAAAASAQRCLAATGTRQPMPLIFGHDRLDLGEFPDLMPQRFRVAARELRAATSALGRSQRLHVVALVRLESAVVRVSHGRAARHVSFWIFAFGGCGRLCGCCVLGGSEEFWGVLPFTCRSNSSIRASSFAIRSRSNPTKPRTAGVISASSSDGIVMDSIFKDDMVYVVLENGVHVQINLPKKRPPGCERLRGDIATMRTDSKRISLGSSMHQRSPISMNTGACVRQISVIRDNADWSVQSPRATEPSRSHPFRPAPRWAIAVASGRCPSPSASSKLPVRPDPNGSA